MTHHLRLEKPPKEVDEEARKLADEYLSRFDDDDIIPDNQPFSYIFEHGSEALKAYALDIHKEQEKAKQEGCML